MDKDLVNNQIILMRKIVRNVKRLVKQKLNKQIKKLELRLNKKIEKLTQKLENKISNKRKELIAINGVNVDEVSKQALIHNKKHFEDIIRSNKSCVDSKALARIAVTENIEKVVNKFKEENPNCDQWLPSQIELWQQKKLIKKNRILKKKGLVTDEEQNDNELQESDNESEQNTQELNETDFKIKESLESLPPKKTLAKNKKREKKEKKIKAIVETKTESKIEEKVPEDRKPKSDPFFLSKDSNLDEESDESDEELGKKIPKKGFKTENFRPKEKLSKFSKTDGRNRNSVQNRKNLKPKKFETKPTNRDTFKAKSGSGEVLHPSWAAKRSAKDKLKIDLNQKPLAKKIKFSE